MRMPFGIRQQVAEIRTYVAAAPEVAHGSLSNDLVTIMVSAADELDVISRFIFSVLGPNPSPPDQATYKPFRYRDWEQDPTCSAP